MNKILKKTSKIIYYKYNITTQKMNPISYFMKLNNNLKYKIKILRQNKIINSNKLYHKSNNLRIRNNNNIKI